MKVWGKNYYFKKKLLGLNVLMNCFMNYRVNIAQASKDVSNGVTDLVLGISHLKIKQIVVHISNYKHNKLFFSHI